MNLSKAIPIRFWLNGQLTWNQDTKITGVFHKKFYQKFQCSDTITIQFTDSEIGLYKLGVYNADDDSLITKIDFTREEVALLQVFTVSFTVNDIDACNNCLYFKILQLSSSLSGSVDELLEEVDGTITSGALSFSIDGDIDELLEEVEGDISFTINSSLFKIANSSVCSASPVTLYWGHGAFGVGVKMYFDTGFTSPVTGYNYIVQSSFGNIFTLNTSTGVVSSDTGIPC